MNKLSLDRVRVERRAISNSGCVVVDMPFPVSVNSLFGQAPGQQRYPSQAYKDWQAQTEWKLLQSKPGRVPGPVHLLFEFEEKDKRQRDVTNYIKAPEDMLVRLNIIDGDHSAVVREITARWSKDVSGARVTIRRAA